MKKIPNRKVLVDLDSLPPPDLAPDLPLPPRPEDVKGLFIFVFERSKGWVAMCDAPLGKVRDELTAGLDATEIALGWALLLVSSHRLDDLCVLHQDVQNVPNSSEAVLMVPSDRPQIYRLMAAHCVELAMRLHQSLGADFRSLMDRYVSRKSPNLTNPSLQKNIQMTIARALTHVIPGSSPPQERGRPPLTVDITMGGVRKPILLTLRAIDVALDVATSLQRAPMQIELQRRLEDLHPELYLEKKYSICPINWSRVFKQAGLGMLPDGRSKPEK